ncbi:MAG: c-type cytochrome [Acidobacteria bacterium]|nr:c-type cytochrome [Acidobacteriota bacterium]
MDKNKYLLLWSSFAAFIVLVIAALSDNYWKDWQQIQKNARADGKTIDVKLRQIVIPELNTTDRCVSCHVSMAPGEQAMTGHNALLAHKSVVHDTSSFGCTICHGGQGLATEKDDAHGNVHFWPEPMLPKEFSYAGCGTCHTPLSVPNLNTLTKGKTLIERYDCLACHRMDGRGGTIRPDGGGMEGNDLSYIGIKGYDLAWYSKHINNHNEAQTGTWRNSFGEISEDDQKNIASFLSTRIGAPKLIEAKALFNSLGCMGCHKVNGVGGDAGADLSRIGFKDPGQLDFSNVTAQHTLANWLAEHFRSPISLVAGSQMPAMGLSEKEIELLTMYVLSLRRRELPSSFSPKDRAKVIQFKEREFATDGRTLYGTFCASCHGRNGEGARYPNTQAFPAIASPDFLAIASDEFISNTIRKGRAGRRMAPWEKDGGLKPNEIEAITKHLRELGKTSFTPEITPPRWVKGDANLGSRLYKANCSGCHGLKGQGGEGPALNNKEFLGSATDTFLVQTITKGRRNTPMAGFENPSPIRQALSQKEVEAIVTHIRNWKGE